MKNLKITKNICVLKNNFSLILLSSSLIITLNGCASKEDYSTQKTTEIATEYIEPTTETTTEYIEPTTEYFETTTEYVEPTTEYFETTTEYVEPTTEYFETTTEYIEPTTETYYESNSYNNETEQSKDEIVTEFINEQKQELQQYIDQNDIENIKSKGKYIFTTLVDFIFYNGEICGIKYDELSEGIKEQLFNDLCDIDTIICNYSPNYKEDLADKYYKVKDYVSPKYYKVKDKVVEYIGTDNMEKLNSIKENGSDVGEDLLNKGKQKIKEIYENYRDE